MKSQVFPGVNGLPLVITGGNPVDMDISAARTFREKGRVRSTRQRVGVLRREQYALCNVARCDDLLTVHLASGFVSTSACTLLVALATLVGAQRNKRATDQLCANEFPRFTSELRCDMVRTVCVFKYAMAALAAASRSF